MCLGTTMPYLHSEDFIGLMDQHTLKNVSKCLNSNIYSYLETSGGQSSDLYLNVLHFFNTSAN
jgi:hypothetical protein